MSASTSVRNSRLSGFYQLPLVERIATVAAWAELTPEETLLLEQGMGVARECRGAL